jgi:hypothetical protein
VRAGLVTEGHGSGATAVDEDLSEPILPGTAPSDYERYLLTDELLDREYTSNGKLEHTREYLLVGTRS